MAVETAQEDEKLNSILEHLEELRKSMIISVAAILIAAVACFWQSESLLNIVTNPMTAQGKNLVVTGVTEAFFVKLKVSIFFGFVIAFPVIMWSLWRFISPALHSHEKKYIYYFVPVSVLLFTGGILFSYFVVLKAVLAFFIYIAGDSLETMFKVDQYAGFILAFTLPFGLVFELPVVSWLLSRLGIINYQFLSSNRKYAILTIAVLSSALTPGGDPISMALMAIPVYILFEISVVVARITGSRRMETVGSPA